jgi:hypothetical protein
VLPPLLCLASLCLPGLLLLAWLSGCLVCFLALALLSLHATGPLAQDSPASEHLQKGRAGRRPGCCFCCCPLPRPPPARCRPPLRAAASRCHPPAAGPPTAGLSHCFPACLPAGAGERSAATAEPLPRLRAAARGLLPLRPSRSPLPRPRAAGQGPAATAALPLAATAALEQLARGLLPLRLCRSPLPRLSSSWPGACCHCGSAARRGHELGRSPAASSATRSAASPAASSAARRPRARPLAGRELGGSLGRELGRHRRLHRRLHHPAAGQPPCGAPLLRPALLPLHEQEGEERDQEEALCVSAENAHS